MKWRSRVPPAVWVLALAVALTEAEDGRILLYSNDPEVLIQIRGDDDEDWHLEFSSDLVHWTTATDFGTLL